MTEHRRCDIALEAGEPGDAKRLELLEVAALASPWRIYLRAMTPEGRPLLVEADYTIVRDAKGLRDPHDAHAGVGRGPAARDPGRGRRQD